MNNMQQKMQIRRRKLAALIADSRMAARRSVAECAEALGVSPEDFHSFETGSASPSLPQLELLSLYLDVPLEHFWGKQSLQRVGVPEPIQEQARALILRNRLVGVTLRLSRTNANLSLAEVAEKTGISEETLGKYETGQASIPLPELEIIAAAMDTPLETFYDKKGPIGQQRSQQELLQEFVKLPLELQEFVSKPVNRPYLELAVRLSQMDALKLRSVAESLLEITF